MTSGHSKRGTLAARPVPACLGAPLGLPCRRCACLGDPAASGAPDGLGGRAAVQRVHAWLTLAPSRFSVHNCLFWRVSVLIALSVSLSATL